MAAGPRQRNWVSRMCPWPDTVTLPEEERIIYGINDGTGIYRKLRRLHTKVYLLVRGWKIL